MTKRKVAYGVCCVLLGLAMILTEENWTAVCRCASPHQTPPQMQPVPDKSAPAGQGAVMAELEKKIAGQENKPAEEVFKNIQILKGQPALRVLRIMSVGFSPALGVDCTHCHVPDQWEKDDKEAKQMARKMWQLQFKVNTDLKEIAGKGMVNCYTCHRGQAKPALNPSQTK